MSQHQTSFSKSADSGLVLGLAMVPIPIPCVIQLASTEFGSQL